MAQLAERLGLDLTDALARHRESLAHFLEDVLALLADAEAEAEDLLLLGRQRSQGALDLMREVLADQGVVRRLGRLVLEEIAQVGVLPDGGFQRQRLPRRLQDEPDLPRRHAV